MILEPLSGMLALSIGSVAAAQANSQPASSPFRYDDDARKFSTAHSDDAYATLKYIPLGEESYLSLGADLRERVEGSNVGLLGFRNRSRDIYDLHRLLVYADLHLGPDVRAFAQIGNHDEVGRERGAAPTDVDRLDLQQGFIDLSRSVGDGRATLRLGRAEMSYDEGALIGLRDGPNVRQVWDGARLTYVLGDWRWDAFTAKPVAVLPGNFDDRPIHGQKLGGVHLTASPRATRPVTIDAFYYWNVSPQVNLFAGSGREETHTFGARARGQVGRFDFSLGGMEQRGQFAGRRVRAFSTHADMGWTFRGLSQPHIQLRADVLSGGASGAGTVTTFNALYPNVAYSTEATIEAPANLVELGVMGRASPARGLTLQYTFEGLWRYSVKDAFYAAPLTPLVRPNGRSDRFSGFEQQLTIAYRLNQLVTVSAAVVHFSVGKFIRSAGGHGENFGMTTLALKL